MPKRLKAWVWLPQISMRVSGRFILPASLDIAANSPFAREASRYSSIYFMVDAALSGRRDSPEPSPHSTLWMANPAWEIT